jgi:hypothetical protein
MRITGQCHCGHVRYRAEIDPQEVSICHCTDCQQLTGSAFRVTASTDAGKLTMTGAAPRLYKKQGDNGRIRLQFFCPECGSPIYTTGEGEDSASVGIRLGSIDQRYELKPARQVWRGSALPWIKTLFDLPGYEGDHD